MDGSGERELGSRDALKWKIQTREDRVAVFARRDIDPANHIRASDGTKPDPRIELVVRQNLVAQVIRHLSDIKKRRCFDLGDGAKQAQMEELDTLFEAEKQRIVVYKATDSKPS